jgi:hypothetical protein
LGRYSRTIDKQTGEINEAFNCDIPYQPNITKDDVQLLYEKNLIEYGFKWSPVKRYYKKLQGLANNNWGLQVRMNARSEEFFVAPQSFALLITFRDPSGGDVYGDLMKVINRPVVELSVEERIRTTLGIF